MAKGIEGGGKNFDLEALRAAQERAEYVGKTVDAGHEIHAEKLVYEKALEDHDRLRAEALELNEEIYPESASRELSDSKALLGQEVEANKSSLDNLRNELEEVKRVVRGKTKIAPEVLEAMTVLGKTIEETEKATDDIKGRLANYDTYFGEIQVGIGQNELIRSRIEEINNKLDQLTRDNPEVMELLYDQAASEKQARNYFDNDVKNRARFERYGDGKRGEKGLEFALEVGRTLLDSELERLGVNGIKDEGERKKRIMDITNHLGRGFEQSTEGSLLDQYNGGRLGTLVADRVKTNPEEADLLVKGHFTARLLNSAGPSGFTVGIAAERWAEQIKKPGKAKEIFTDLLPVINKLKAASSVDSARPGVEEDSTIYEGPQPTNLYFNKSGTYYAETFKPWEGANQGRNTLLDPLKRAGFETGGDGPIYSKELEETPEGRKELARIRAEYTKELKRRQKEVNEARKEKERTRQERMKEIPKEIAKIEAIIKEKSEKAAKRQKAVEELKELRGKRSKLEDTKSQAEMDLRSSKSSFNNAGVFAKRKTFGKGEARQTFENAQARFKRANQDIDKHDNRVQQLEKFIEEYHDAIGFGPESYTHFTAGYEARQKKEKLEEELAALGASPYNQVEIVK